MKDLLPAYELLSKEQDQAIRCPMTKSLLVTGPPGSGKTVIALYRAKALRKQSKDVDIIVYGNVLFAYLRKSLEQLKLPIDVATDTYHKWLRKYCMSRFGRAAPTLGDPFTYDWEQITRWHTNGRSPEFDQLIIDEAQDLPTSFLRLAPYLSDAITVFADENQMIFEDNSTLAKIRQAMARFSPTEVKLTQNYRNTAAIARLASIYCTKGIETGVTRVPAGRSSGALPELCKYPSDAQQAKRILTYASNHPDHQVGVFLPRKSEVLRWHEMLKSRFKGDVQYWAWRKGKPNDHPDFRKSGIFVVTYHSAKGLEFDAVFLPELQDVARPDVDTAKMLLYVVMSRARSSLVLMHSAEPPAPAVMDPLEQAERNGKILVKRIDLASKAAKADPVSARRVGAGEWKISWVLDKIDSHLTENQFARLKNVLHAKYKNSDIVQSSAVKATILKGIRDGLAGEIIRILSEE